MFGLGYSKPVEAAGSDDDEAILGGKDDFQNGSSMGGGSGFGGFGGGGFGEGGSSNNNNSSGAKDPFAVDKDAWLKGNDSTDPFGQKSSSSTSSMFGIGGKTAPVPAPNNDPFGQNRYNNNNNGNNNFGGFSNNSSSSSDAFGSNSSSNNNSSSNSAFGSNSYNNNRIPDYYVTDRNSEKVHCCVSCYNRMSKKLATSVLGLRPNDNNNGGNYNSGGNNGNTICDVCQRNVREAKDAITSGASPTRVGGGTMTGIGSDSFPRPGQDSSDNRGSFGGDRGSFGGGAFGGGDGRRDSTGSGRGSEDLTAGMIKMQPAGGKQGSIFGSFGFGGSGTSNGKKY
jgi:hypothetical protein